MDATPLKDVPLFAGVSDEDLSAIAERCHTVDVYPFARLVHEGDFGYRFFVVLDGTASVRLGDEEIARLGPGEFFGEVALLDHERRIATVEATTHMTLATMMVWDFDQMLADQPAVAERIREAATARER